MTRWLSALCSALVVGTVTGCGMGLTPAPSSAPIAIPTVAPTPAASSRPTQSGDGPCSEKLILPAGRRSITSAQTETPFAVEITFTDGWTGCGLAYKELGEPGGVMMIGYWDARMVYPNPCHWKGDVTGPDTGQAVQDLMAALAAQELTSAGRIENVTIDGYHGRYVRLEVAPDLDTSGCDADHVSEFRFWNGPGDSVWWLGAVDAPGLIGEVWALDVDGFRFVIQAATFADAGEASRNEIRRMVESIDIQP